jgi:hypothetical protein
MLRRAQQLLRGSLLDDPARAHDGDLVRDLPDDGQVVGDEKIGQAVGLLQVAQELQHLGLY